MRKPEWKVADLVRARRPRGPRRPLRALRALLALLLVAATAGCGREPYYIGVMADPAAVDAARLGVLQINFSEGVEGRPLRLRPFRLQPTTTPAEMRDTLRAWSRDSAVVAAIVTSGNWTVQGVSETLSRGGVPHVFATAEPLLEPEDPNRYYVVPVARREAEFMAEQAQLREDARAGVIYVDNDMGRVMRAALAAKLEELGVPLVAEAAYPQVTDESQLISLVSELAEARPNIVYWIGEVAELTAVYPSIRGLLPEAVVVANSRVETRHLYFNPQGHYSGLRFVRMLDVRDPDPELQDFVFRNSSWSGGETTSRDAIVYDASLLLADALRSGEHDRAGIRAYLAALGRERPAFEGVAGPIVFTEPGPAVEREHELAEVLPGGVRVARSLAPAGGE